jgi:DNA-directed RNA polymerase sigma subunit (sigma70/sigma32)
MNRRYASTTTLSPTEERELFDAYEAGDMKARDRLITAMVPMAYSYARRYSRSRDGHFDDLLQAGLLGATQAFDNFDRSRGMRFYSYANWYIKAAVRNYYRQTRVVTPGSDDDRVNKEVLDSYMAGIPVSEIAKAMGQSIEYVERVILGVTAKAVPLDLPANDTGLPLWDRLDSGEPTPHALVAEKDVEEKLREIFKEEMSGLVPKQRLVLKARFLDEETMSLPQIGKCFGVTRQRIEQIQRQAILNLKSSRPLARFARKLRECGS